MKKILSITLLIVFTGIQFSCENNENPKPEPEPKKIETTPQIRQLIGSDNAFGFDLMKKIHDSQEEPKNTMISPVSVALALAMTYNGAEGDTKTAMEEALRLSGLSRQEINESYQALIESLLSVDPKVTMEIANSIWYREGFEVEQDFLDVNREYYDAEVAALDFDSPEAVEIINQWVSEKTHEKIPKIVEQIDPLTVMYLINAMYFNGKWRYQFEEEKTSRQPFYLSDGSTIQTEMMQTEADLNYMSHELFRAVELPYGRGNYTMVCMLPQGNHGVGDVIEAFTSGDWNTWMDGLQETPIQLHLPKFKFEYKKKLNDILKIMGMEVAFDPYQADFSGINPNVEDLYISEVLHKTFVEVDEKGTEAAAVTSVAINITSIGGGGPMVMKFDRPFVFAIREVTTGSIVFMGKVVEP